MEIQVNDMRWNATLADLVESRMLSPCGFDAPTINAGPTTVDT